MQSVKQQLEMLLMLVVVVAGLLVGVSVESPVLAAIGIVGAVVAYVVTDRLQVFQVAGQLANVASFAILLLVFYDFSGGDNAQKLTAVAKLLVYLQAVLMFQPKTPRLVWQVLILTLLQVVISAIFTLNFEASFLFATYFVLAGIVMMLQTVYVQQRRISEANERSRNRLAGLDAVADHATQRLKSEDAATPIVIQELSPQGLRLVSNRLFQFLLWMLVSASFAAIAFCVLPRHTSPWYGPASHQVTTAGMLTAVDLEQRGKLRLSKAIVFRASFEDLQSGRTLTNLGSPYFRAVAFSKVEVKNGRTSFTAPYDRVYPDEVYQRIPSQRRGSRESRAARQLITLEKTTDPLVYEVMPVFRTSNTPEELEFCHEISAYTRCREQDQISVAPYKYETGTLLDQHGQFLTAWPFVSNTKRYRQLPLSEDPVTRAWLLQVDRERYPGVVGAAEEIAVELRRSGRGRLAIARKMASHFRQAGLYRYTTDFTEVRRDRRIDPIEDFFSNHRQGHCELYAAALTLMLRSQGIPARLVVGFHGSEFNALTSSFFVRGTDAHAWVEVYLRPEDCPERMFNEGSAGPGGAWYILDPTPGGTADDEPANNETAIEIARSVWQDYVLGMGQDTREQTEGTVPESLIRLISSFDVEEIDGQLTRARKWATDPQTKWVVIGWLAGLFALRLALVYLLGSVGWNWQWPKSSMQLRAMVGDAIAILAPKLGSWVRGAGGTGQSTAFYRRMTQLLARRGWERTLHQTHRDFANTVAAEAAEEPRGEQIGQLVHELTERFHAVRFGQRKMGEHTRQQVQQQLSELESALE